MVTPPSPPANIHDVSHQGQDGLRPADASEASVGVPAAALAIGEVAVEYPAPRTYEDGQRYNAAPTVVVNGGSTWLVG
jgi:hypothetical protein